MLRRLLLATFALLATEAAPMELYFEFDERATSVSAAPGLYFCRGAMTALLPTYGDRDAWCNFPNNHGYAEKILYGGLSNARVRLPQPPSVSNFDSAAARANVSASLLSSGFFLSPVGVQLIVDYQRDLVLNAVVTSLSFAALIASAVIMRFCAPPSGE